MAGLRVGDDVIGIVGGMLSAPSDGGRVSGVAIDGCRVLKSTGNSVGTSVNCSSVGATVTGKLGREVGLRVGSMVGSTLGTKVGSVVGRFDGVELGSGVGEKVGDGELAASEGVAVVAGINVTRNVGLAVGGSVGDLDG